MIIGRDIIEPPSHDYLGYRLNEYNGLVGIFKYIGDKGVLQKKCKNSSESSSEIDFSSIVGEAPEELDTLGEIATALSSKEDKISGKGLSTNDYTDEDKEKVANAYIKPQSGIPASDLADNVIPDVSGKENTSNKVTSLSAQSTDTQYPSAKATYDAINPPIVTTQPVGGFLPNVVYDLGTLTGTVTFALAAVTDATIANAYHWTFDTGSTAPTITWPSGIVWPDGFTPSVDASMHYEVLVRNGYASMLSYSLS